MSSEEFHNRPKVTQETKPPFEVEPQPKLDTDPEIEETRYAINLGEERKIDPATNAGLKAEIEKRWKAKQSEDPIDSPDTNRGTQLEIKREFIDQIIDQENKRYRSEEALNRANRIDADFPSTLIEKAFNKYKSQKKNIEYMGHDPRISIGDWLAQGVGGQYRKQPALVSRKNDFIEVTNSANPDQITQILQHEYNHMFTQGHSNFSNRYQEYIRSIFFGEKDLKSLSQEAGKEILATEPFPGAGPVYLYLTTPGEINAYLGTNLRNDLLRAGLIKTFYDEINTSTLELALTIKDSNSNRKETPIYQIYLTMLKDKEKLLFWLNNYAI